jgi:CheY-like chemotaxis protein
MGNKRQLLIVDDSEENLLFLSQILDDNGYSYRVARNGTDALAAIRESTPDAVLLDLMMPRKGGIAVFREVKRDRKLRKIPIIVVTGASQVTGIDLKTGAEEPKAGSADGFLRRMGEHLRESLQDIEPDGLVEKPIDPRLLIQTIEGLLG